MYIGLTIFKIKDGMEDPFRYVQSSFVCFYIYTQYFKVTGVWYRVLFKPVFLNLL